MPRAKATDPELRFVLRQFLRLVHPDLFGAFPELRETNERSMQRLMGVLAHAKSGEHEAHMPPVREELVFFLRTDADAHFRKISVALRLTGGDQKNVLARHLAELFDAAGLPTVFHWGKDYWNKTLIEPQRRQDPDQEEDQEEQEQEHAGRARRAR